MHIAARNLAQNVPHCAPLSLKSAASLLVIQLLDPLQKGLGGEGLRLGVDAGRFLERQVGSMHVLWAVCRGGRTIPTPDSRPQQSHAGFAALVT